MRQNTLLTMLYAEYQNTDMQNMSICYDIIYVYSDHLVQSAHIGGGSRKEKKVLSVTLKDKHDWLYDMHHLMLHSDNLLSTL